MSYLRGPITREQIKILMASRKHPEATTTQESGAASAADPPKPIIPAQAVKTPPAAAPGESENEFRMRLAHIMREKRDLAVEKLRKKYEKRFTTLRDRLMRAEQAIARERYSERRRQG